MILVIGYGSIGIRHTRLLRELGEEVCVLSRHAEGADTYKTLEDAFAAHKTFSRVLIANKTAEHAGTFEQLAHFHKGPVLVEKPLFHQHPTYAHHGFESVHVAYNLRFHPLLQALKEQMEDDTVLSLQIYAGQYLPQWRPQRDYRESYSSKKAEGGGVLRDLSHELDYAHWLGKGCSHLYALGGHLSDLSIDSDDVFALLFRSPKCPVVSIQVNYMDRLGQRYIHMVGNKKTVHVNLIQNTLCVNGEVQSFSIDRDESYRRMHKAWLSEAYQDLCTWEQGLSVLKMIDDAEACAKCAQDLRSPDRLRFTTAWG